MSNVTPSVIEQVPAGGNVSKPSSGSYGDVKSLDDLRAALPGSQSSEPREMSATPTSLPEAPRPSAPAGLPPGLLAPSRQPDVPVSQPMSMPAGPPVGSPQEKRIALLDSLAKSPNVSAETREWAQRNLNWIVRQAGQ